MRSELDQASELTAKLRELAKSGRTAYGATVPRSGDEVAVDQLAVFGELLVVLATYMDRAQKTIRNLTWALTALTAVLVIDALIRVFNLH